MAAADPYLPPHPSARALPAGFTTLVVAVAAVLVAGLVSAAALSTSSSQSPGDAVQALLRSASTGNVAGMLDTLDPAERDAIAPTASAVVDDLKHLGVLADNADLRGLAGLSVTFADVGTKTESLSAVRAGLAAVVFTKGTATVRIDANQLPLGALVKGFVSRVPPIDRSVPLGGAHAEKHPLVVIQRDGHWYVSLGYTAAEIARRDAGLGLPSAQVPAVGAASAVDAVRALVTAVTDGDARRAIELIDPADAGALHDYGSLLLQQLPTSLKLPVKVTDLQLATRPVNGGTMVSVTRFSATTPGGTVSYTGRCLAFGAHQICEPSGSNLLAGYGLVAVQRDGSWFVDPYRTVLDDAEHALASLDLKDLAGLGRGGPLSVFSRMRGQPPGQ